MIRFAFFHNRQSFQYPFYTHQHKKMSSTDIVAEVQQTLDGLDDLVATRRDLKPFECDLSVEAIDYYMMVVGQKVLASVVPIPIQYQPRFLKQITKSRGTMKTYGLSTTQVDNLVAKMLEKMKEDAGKELGRVEGAAQELESGKSKVCDDSSQVW